jgi:DNA polymerase III subunit delta'
LLDHLIGNERVKGYLRRMVQEVRVGHTLLFSGPDGIGKSLFAKELATELLMARGDRELHRRKVESGQHPDLHIYKPAGKSGMHPIERMRDLCAEVYLPPNEAAWKCFIIDEADRMLATSGNLLLKTFEEPPADTLIVLITSEREQLLPTIRSRCRTVHFEPIPTPLIAGLLRQRYPTKADQAEKWAQLSRGSLGRALRLAESGDDMKRQLLLDALGKGRLSEADGRLRVANELAELIEKERELAASREGAEEEAEGAASGATFREIDWLFQDYLGWFRDLLLLRAKGPRMALYHSDYAQELAGYAGEVPPLYRIEEAIREAQLALRRFCKLSFVLEVLFSRVG